MRNLKRALSLTLASVMLLGMMVVGSSAAAGYDDVSEDDNVEAIEVLQTIEVMVGDERGFGPERPVNRAEMAVVMAKLLNLDYNYYTATCPFDDVYDWARGYVGACYANKILSGRGDGIYDPGATVTAVEAALMLMRALGYFQYSNDYTDGWDVATVRQGTTIGIFEGVGSSATEPMTRNQVAQMVLNALQSGMVEPDGNTTTFLNPDGTVLATTGKVNYVFRTSAKPFAQAISPVQATAVGSQNGGPIVELGEQLYDGKLTLVEDNVGGWVVNDEFGRPSRHWEYDGKVIGTYAKVELLRQEYTQKVTGKMLYELLGKDAIDNYDIDITIDGETAYSVLNNHGYFSNASMIRTNTDAVGATGDGVLTQVFVDGVNKTVDIAIINTYLAKARQDYNTRDEDVDLTVYKINDDGVTNHYVKSNGTDGVDGDGITTEVMTVEGEDFDIVDVKDGDLFLVTVAEGEIQSMVKPEIISEATINAFKNQSWVKSEEAQYDYATTAQYDDEVLDQYSVTNMKDVTYNIILDKYGYLIGLELNEEVNQYVFLTGIDLGGSNLSAKDADANVIFLDGTMKTIRVNTEKSELASKPAGHDDDDGTDFTVTGGGAEFAGGAMLNTWCTYSVDSSGVYTLKQVGDRSTARSATPAVRSAKKIAQSAMDMSDLTLVTKDAKEVVINAKNVSLEGSKIRDDGSETALGGGTYNLLGDFEYVYGNEDTVYINVDLKHIEDKIGDDAVIVEKVSSVSTGVKNVDITVNELDDKSEWSGYVAYLPDDEIYTLYSDKGYIIAVVTLDAEDNGTTSSWAYITSDVKQEEYLGNGDWRWTREAIIDGRAVKLTEVDDDYDLLSPSKMQTGAWYELRFDADGNVTKLVPNNAPTTPNRIDFTVANDKFVTDVLDVRLATNGIGSYSENDSVLLYSDFTCNGGYSNHGAGNNVANLRYEDGTLYTSSDTSKGFSVAPDVKVVVCLSNKHGSGEFDKIVDTYEGWNGLEDALKSLDCEKSAFDGYLSAVFSNGRATSIILDDRSGSHVGVIETAPGMDITISLVDSSNNWLVDYTTRIYGTTTFNSDDAALTALVSGYSEAADQSWTPTFVENGSATHTFRYKSDGGASTGDFTKTIRVRYCTGDTDNPVPVMVDGKTATQNVKIDGGEVGFGELVAKDCTAPVGYVVSANAAKGNTFPMEIDCTSQSAQSVDVFVELDDVKAIALNADNAADSIELAHSATVDKAGLVAALKAANIKFDVTFGTGADAKTVTVDADSDFIANAAGRGGFDATTDGEITVTAAGASAKTVDVTAKVYTTLTITGANDVAAASFDADKTTVKAFTGDTVTVVFTAKNVGAYTAGDLSGATKSVTPTGSTTLGSAADAPTYVITHEGLATATDGDDGKAIITVTFKVATLAAATDTITIDIQK